ncbi:MarR family transcriptional regulator [Natrinema altunense]|uniref:MarR family transcriptional regulator n=2 Tax=Natrinema TaxID=88723 RepID=A0A482XY40_9EURY|nr:helix-turn-helix domain-containing protein [Natrinema altunense]RZH66953.1 MarR family transcriptional regulator [Natrinema altunense]
MSTTEPDAELDGDGETDDRGDGGDEWDRDGDLSELPPSAKLVYKVLEYEAPLTQEGIAAESRLCSRTVRYALGKLEEQDLITSRACLEDARQSKYRLAA